MKVNTTKNMTEQILGKIVLYVDYCESKIMVFYREDKKREQYVCYIEMLGESHQVNEFSDMESVILWIADLSKGWLETRDKAECGKHIMIDYPVIKR